MSELEQAKQQADRLADDLLIGAPAIAAELGCSERQVYYFVETKKLPIGKFGKNLIASRAKLRRATNALRHRARCIPPQVRPLGSRAGRVSPWLHPCATRPRRVPAVRALR